MALALIVTMFDLKFLSIVLILLSALICLQGSGSFPSPVADLKSNSSEKFSGYMQRYLYVIWVVAYNCIASI